MINTMDMVIDGFRDSAENDSVFIFMWILGGKMGQIGTSLRNPRSTIDGS